MATRPRPELEETFLALRRVMGAMRGRFAATLRAHDLTFPQWILLKSLARKGQLPAKELAGSCGLTPANVTGVVDRLEDAGLVTRTRSKEDRRVVFVELTQNGQVKTAQILGVAEGSLASMFDGWSDKELAELRALLGRFQMSPEDTLDL
jgi:DNA-binding MarR family transcriptional regulator